MMISGKLHGLFQPGQIHRTLAKRRDLALSGSLFS
jgi:hypothetical protein